MILLFLGNWRSTLIVIMVEIPLAILFSLTAAVVARGDTQRHDFLLGGLALAVGILVL